ncbi:MAG: hypothetical protein GY906_04920 [bacterium]|nr:hypothetical protein [bacterium]
MGRLLPPVPMASVKTILGYAERGIDGRNWYAEANGQIDYVSREEGWDHAEFCGILATTSPRCSVLRNIRLGLHFMHHRDLRVIPMKGIRTSVTNFLDGKGINGPKTGPFCANLSGDYNPVTLDVWMAYAFGIDQSDFSRKATHREASSRVVEAGRVLGIKPAQAQAAIWTGYRRNVGYTDSPFSIVSEYRTARDNGWDIEGCEIKEGRDN